MFEPTGRLNPLSGVRTLFIEFDRFKSSKATRIEIFIYFGINLEKDFVALHIIYICASQVYLKRLNDIGDIHTFLRVLVAEFKFSK